MLSSPTPALHQRPRRRRSSSGVLDVSGGVGDGGGTAGGTSGGHDSRLNRRHQSTTAAAAAAAAAASGSPSRHHPAHRRRLRHMLCPSSTLATAQCALLIMLALVMVVTVDLARRAASLPPSSAALQHACPSIGTSGSQHCSARPFLSTQMGLPEVAKGGFTLFKHFRVAHKWQGMPAHPRSSPVIAVSTQLTPDRMPRLERLVNQWQGPVAACLFVCSVEELATVAEAYDSNPTLQAHLSLHVLVGRAHFIPINVMRNIASTAVPDGVEWQFVLDVDAMPSASMAHFSEDLALAVDDATAEYDGQASVADATIFVAPAMEITDVVFDHLPTVMRSSSSAAAAAATVGSGSDAVLNAAAGGPVPSDGQLGAGTGANSVAEQQQQQQDEEHDTEEEQQPSSTEEPEWSFWTGARRTRAQDVDVYDMMPSDKPSLRRLFDVGAVRTMHVKQCATSYGGPFKPDHWMGVSQSYEVPYERGFEGYYIIKRPAVPFDERFVGRQRNKQSQYFEMFARGFKIRLLAKSWLVDTPNNKAVASKGPRVEALNSRKWAQFLSDVMAKYPDTLACTDGVDRRGQPCWWEKESADNRARLWSFFDSYWMRRECSQLAAIVEEDLKREEMQAPSLVHGVPRIGGIGGAAAGHLNSPALSSTRAGMRMGLGLGARLDTHSPRSSSPQQISSMSSYMSSSSLQNLHNVLRGRDIPTVSVDGTEDGVDGGGVNGNGGGASHLNSFSLRLRGFRRRRFRR